MAVELAAAYVTILPSTRQLGAGILGELNGAKLQGGVGKSGSRMGASLGAGVKKSFKAAGLGAAVLGAFTLKKGLDRALGIEDARAKLQGLGHDAKSVKGVMDSALKSVKGTAFGLDKAATTAAGAVAAGIKPGQQLTKYLKQTADAATIAGVDMGEMGSIFNKVQTNGKAYTDDLQQLSDRGIPIFQYLRKEYGVSADKLSEMVRKGQVDSATYNKVIRENLGGAALESGNTTRGAFKNLEASLGRIGEGLLSGIFPSLRTGAQGITKALIPMEARAKSVGTALGKYVSVFTPKVVEFFNGLGPALSKLQNGKAGGETSKSLSSIGTSLKAIGPGLKEARDELPSFSDLLKVSALGLRFVADNIGLVAKFMPVLVGGIVAYKVAQLAANVAAVAAVPTKIAEVIVNRQLVKSNLALIASRSGVVASTAADTVAQNANTATRSRSIFGLVAQRVALIATGTASRIAAAGTFLLNTAMRANPIGIVITALTLLGAGLVLAYKKSDTFRAIVQGAWAGIKQAISVGWGVIKVVFAAFSGYLTNVLFPVIGFLYNRVVKPYFSAISTVIGTVWRSGIKPVFGAISDGIGGVRSAIGGAVSGIRTVWNGLKEAFSGPVDWVLRNVINPLVSAIDSVAKLLTGDVLIGKKFGLEAKADTRPSGGKASGAARNGFMRGGWTGPGAKTKVAGVVHGDEFVHTKWARRRLERQNPGGLDEMNATGRWPGYLGGGRVKPLAGGTPSTYAGHTGVDFNAPNDFGKPIQAAAAGVVSLVKHLKTSYGNYVQLTHPGGTRTIYGHMSQTLARVGQQVAAGQTIGKVGSTGNSTGPHLHFEVRPGGTYASSMAFLAGAKSVGATGAASSGMDPLATIKSKIAKIRKGIGGNSIVKAFGSGSLGKLGAQAIDWVKGKAGSAASLLSPAYSVGKAVLAKVNGGNAKSAAKGALGGYGWGADQFGPLNRLWTRESGWNPRARNPKSGAYGIPQALPGSKMASAGDDWRTNAGTQIKWGLGYIKQRYGSPAAAWAHSQRTGWYANGGHVREGVYDQGGKIMPGSTMVRNKSKKPEALLSASQWKAIQKLAGISDRNRRLRLETVNSKLQGQPLPYTLTKKAEKQKKAIDKLEREYDKARTKAERKKIAAEIKTAKTELGKTRDQRETVRKLIDQRRRIELRAARAMPNRLTGRQRGVTLGKFNAMTIGKGAGVTSGFLSGQLGILPKTADQLQKEFQRARNNAVGAQEDTLRASRNTAIAQANARPVQDRLASVKATLAQAKGSDVLRESFRKESATIKQLSKQRAKADSEKEAKKIQKQIDAARLRQLALVKERNTNRSLAAEKKRLENDRRLKALTAAQKAQTAATAAQTAADEKATAAAETYKAAQDAAIEKASSIRDVGVGLGSISSASSKTSGGIISNLKRSITTVGTWGAVASALIKGGLRGPIMEEFLTAGPSKESVRLGRSLLSGGKIGQINALQSQLRAEATNAGSISGAYLANPGALAVSRTRGYIEAGPAAENREVNIKIEALDPSRISSQIRREVKHVMTDMAREVY